MDAIRVELSGELIELINPPGSRTGLLESIKMLRDDIDKSDALTVPKVHVVDNLALPESSYEMFIRGNKVDNGIIADTGHSTELLTR